MHVLVAAAESAVYYVIPGHGADLGHETGLLLRGTGEMKGRLLALAAAGLLGSGARAGPNPFDNLVAFGDSFTDEGRLGYFIDHNGAAPPTGMILPESNNTASGGLSWGRFVARATGAKYYDYAVSGATCSNRIVERNFAAINAPFPSVTEYEIPAFMADTGYKSPDGVATYPNRTAENTVYALWIGTNDLGYGAMLTDSNAPGTTLSSFVDCVFEVFDSIYDAGGRRFVLLNQAPLDLLPIYAAPAAGGTLDNKFFPNKTAYNMTEVQYKIKQYTTSVNTMFEYGVPYHLLVRKRWPSASFTIFDVHSLLSDIYKAPEKYLDAPANATGYYIHCDIDFSNCVNSKNPLSSFLWYDELHPSEKAGEWRLHPSVASQIADSLHCR